MLSPETHEFLEKVAYGDAEHKNLLHRGFRHLGHDNISHRAKELISRGDLRTDYGIRTPPMLINDPLHAFQSTSRKEINKAIKTNFKEGIRSIADSITDRKQGFMSKLRAARGLMDIGTAHHTLMDLTAHTEKMRRMGLHHEGPKTGFGGAVQAIKQHVDHAQEMDVFHHRKDKMDRRAGDRNLKFMSSLAPELRSELMSRGMRLRDARKATKK